MENEEATEEGSKKAEAVYYAALALLDELPREDRRLVVLNWVKYITLTEAAPHPPDGEDGLRRSMEAMTALCRQFAFRVLSLPHLYVDSMMQAREIECTCARCEARRAAQKVAEENLQ